MTTYQNLKIALVNTGIYNLQNTMVVGEMVVGGKNKRVNCIKNGVKHCISLGSRKFRRVGGLTCYLCVSRSIAEYLGIIIYHLSSFNVLGR